MIRALSIFDLGVAKLVNGLLIYSFNPQPKARSAPLSLAYGCGLNNKRATHH